MRGEDGRSEREKTGVSLCVCMCVCVCVDVHALSELSLSLFRSFPSNRVSSFFERLKSE